jgi:hypothetical protein
MATFLNYVNEVYKTVSGRDTNITADFWGDFGFETSRVSLLWLYTSFNLSPDSTALSISMKQKVKDR